MRTLIFITLFFLTSSYYGQVQKIKVKRVDTLLCDYKFVADPGLIDKIYRLNLFRFTSPDNFKKNTANAIRSNLRLTREKALFVNKLYFDSLVSNVCIINKFKLSKIEIKLSGDTNHIQINFNYKKIQK